MTEPYRASPARSRSERADAYTLRSTRRLAVDAGPKSAARPRSNAAFAPGSPASRIARRQSAETPYSYPLSSMLPYPLGSKTPVRDCRRQRYVDARDTLSWIDFASLGPTSTAGGGPGASPGEALDRVGAIATKMAMSVRRRTPPSRGRPAKQPNGVAAARVGCTNTLSARWQASGGRVIPSQREGCREPGGHGRTRSQSNRLAGGARPRSRPALRRG